MRNYYLVWKAAFLLDLFRDSTLYDSHEGIYVWVTQRARPLLLRYYYSYLPMEELDSCPHLAPLLGRGGGNKNERIYSPSRTSFPHLGPVT